MDKSTGYPGVRIKHGYVVFRIQRKGKVYQESVGPEAKANVEQANRERLRLVALIDSGQIQFEELWDRGPEVQVISGTLHSVALEWIEFVKPFRNKKKRYAGSSLDTVKQHLNAVWIPALGSKPLNLITPADVRKVIFSPFYGELKEKTLRNFVSSLATVLAFADEKLRIECKPYATADAKYPERLEEEIETIPYDPEELKLLFTYIAKNFDLKTQTYFTLFRGAGMRTGEILGLEWNDIRGDRASVTKAVVRNEIKPPKTWEKRKVYLQPQVIEALNKLRDSEKQVISIGSVSKGDYIFKNEVESHYNDARRFNDAWTEAHENVTLPAAVARRLYNDLRAEGEPEDQISPYLDQKIPKREPYKLRHTRASELISMGCADDGPRELGHSPLVFYTVYAKQISAYENSKKDFSKLNSQVQIG